METVSVGDHGVTATEMIMYKAWQTRLGGKWFMTWEPKGVFDGEDFTPEVWFVFRIEKPEEDVVDLYMVNSEFAAFKEVDETRRAYERVIKKNVKNDKMYSDEAIRLTRVKPEHLGFFEDLSGEIISFE